MNLYTIVTNDEYELPVKCDLKVKEAAEFLCISTNDVRRMAIRPKKKCKYRVIISGKYKCDIKMNKKIYDMTHDRTEYFREYQRKRRERMKKQ